MSTPSSWVDAMTNLSSFLASQTGRHATRRALQSRPRYRTHTLSYQQLAERVTGITAALARSGVGPGDRVLLFAENSPDWVAAFFAVMARGAIVVPLNPKSPATQLERLVAAAEPKLNLLSSRSPWPATPRPQLVIDDAVDCQQGPTVSATAFPSDADSVAEIIYTSGTTGEPKGVMLSHGNLLSNLEAVHRAVPLQPDDHVLTLLPLFHVFGQMTGILCPLRAGASVTYLAAPTSRAILDALAHTPATHLVVIPEVLKTMMDRLEARLGRLSGWSRRCLAPLIRRRLSRSLRTIVCGGAPLDPELEEKWWALGFEVLQGYGLTETSPVVAVNTAIAHRIGSVGKAVEGVQLRITDDGEIVVRGPGVMQGYFRNATGTAEVLSDGWFRTGDGGRLDEAGFLHVFGRKKYMILGPSGENVFPEDLEAELNRVPGIIDSAVVGLASNGRTTVHAVLICDAEHEERAGQCVAEANRHLAPHQQIMGWSLWPDADFPRSVTRKVKKEAVIRRLTEHRTVSTEPAGRRTPLRRLVGEITGAPLSALGDTVRLVADLGVDSLLRVELVARIEDEFGAALQEVQITPATTLAQLETLVDHARGQAPIMTRYPRWSLAPWARLLRPLARALFLGSWLRPFCRLQVSGREHLERLNGPALLMANHRSYLDSAVASFALPRHIRSRLAIAAATQVLYHQYRWAVPMGELALNAFPFPTGVDENIRPGLDYIGHLLDDGWHVLIFPEGQMNRSGRPLLDLKGGTGVLAAEMGVPIIPVAILGTAAIMPPGTVLPRRRGPVEIRFGAPVTVAPQDHHATLTARVQAAIERLLAN